MARRENQGIHIALISCVIVTVLFMVLTYFFWSRSADLARQIEGKNKQISDLNTTAGKAVLDAEQLKAWIGYATQVDVQEIKADFEKDMLTYAQSLPDLQRNYRELPAHLMSVNQERHQRISAQAEEIRKLTEDLANTRKQMNDEVATAKQAHAKAVADLNSVTDQNEKQRGKLNTEKDELVAKANEERQLRLKDADDAKTEIAALSKQVKETSAIAEDRQKTIANLTKLSFDVPDGKITWVNPRENTAFINLGKEDGLRPQVTFTVFAVDVNNLAKESPKGSVEVTRVINDKLSEVRITEDNLADPILSGDMIYTPVWDAKSALRFALLGKMDVNDNGRDDRQIVKNLISMNNGKIDAEDVDGKMVGRLSRNTKYLIIGESSSENDNSTDADRSIRTAMINEARALGIEEVSLDEILKFMGFNGERRVVPLGKRAREDDFKAKPYGSEGRSANSRRRSAS